MTVLLPQVRMTRSSQLAGTQTEADTVFLGREGKQFELRDLDCRYISDNEPSRSFTVLGEGPNYGILLVEGTYKCFHNEESFKTLW